MPLMEKNIIINVDLFIDGLNHLERSMKKLKKTYYTDRHEKEEKVKYCNEVYIPTQYKLSTRQPVWVIIPFIGNEDQIEALSSKVLTMEKSLGEWEESEEL